MRCSSDLFLPSGPRTGSATTYITEYGSGPIGSCEENNNFSLNNNFRLSRRRAESGRWFRKEDFGPRSLKKRSFSVPPNYW